jgi:hypothetical protein
MENRSELLGFWGQLWEIARILVNEILAKGGTDEDVLRLKHLGPQIADLVIAARPQKPLEVVELVEAASHVEAEELEVIEIELDPDLSLAKQIKLGNYPAGCVHKAYTDGRVKLSGKSGKRVLVVLDPKGEATILEMVKVAKALGLSQPVWDDAVAMGYQKPSRQVENPLIFPTEETVLVDVSRPCVPFLDGWRHERSLNLNGAGYRFIRNFRFVFVRES